MDKNTDESKKDGSKSEMLLKLLPVICTVIAGAFSFFNYLFFDRINQELAKTNQELTNANLKIENELRPREFENNLKLTLYKEVKEAIGQRDTAMQNATLLVINEMLEEDSVFREKLISILLQSAGSSKLIKTQQKLDDFQEEQAAIKPNKLTIDVFYPEDSENAESRADSVCSVLRSKYPDFTVRKRLLPRVINAKVGFRMNFNQIRYSTAEKQIAEDILTDMRNLSVFDSDLPKLVSVKNKMRNYLSIFVGSNPPRSGGRLVK
ncbi:MAG: hypothetical protein LBR60_02095 [Fibrobacter sp.]|jgi:hypothetical protein|nr:hypothetical protein [Fibrobacter sp.]